MIFLSHPTTPGLNKSFKIIRWILLEKQKVKLERALTLLLVGVGKNAFEHFNGLIVYKRSVNLVNQFNVVNLNYSPIPPQPQLVFSCLLKSQRQ